MTKCDHVESVAISSLAGREKINTKNIQFKRVPSYFHSSIQGKITSGCIIFLWWKFKRLLVMNQYNFLWGLPKNIKQSWYGRNFLSFDFTLLLYTIGLHNTHHLIDQIRNKTKINCTSFPTLPKHGISISLTHPSAARLSCLFCALLKFFFWVAVILQYQLAY